MIGDGTHEKRRHTIADLADPFCEFSGEDECIREGPEALELGKREPPSLIPMHRTAHSQVAVHSPYGMSRLLGIESNRIESIPRDVLLRSADPDAVPEAIGLLLPARLE